MEDAAVGGGIDEEGILEDVQLLRACGVNDGAVEDAGLYQGSHGIRERSVFAL